MSRGMVRLFGSLNNRAKRMVARRFFRELARAPTIFRPSYATLATSCQLPAIARARNLPSVMSGTALLVMKQRVAFGGAPAEQLEQISTNTLAQFRVEEATLPPSRLI